MPLSLDEQKRLDARFEDLKGELQELKGRMLALESGEGKRMDRHRHELSMTLEGATHVIENMLKPLTDQVHQTFAMARETTPMIQSIEGELKESAAERTRRSEREKVLAEENEKKRLEAAAIEVESLRRAREREHSIKVVGAITALLAVVAGLLAAMINSYAH